MNPLTQQLPRTAEKIESGIQRGWHLGAQIYVQLGPRVVIDAAVGHAAAGVLMTPEIVNVWFSSGKPLTTVAIAQLWERNLLSLDDSVANFIPEFATGGKEGITIRHLLNHTAGFRGADRVKDDLPWNEAIEAICAVPAEPSWVPGKRAGYQLFSSWFVLGEIVHRLDGRSINRYVTEEIFNRLGMRDCWMGLPAEHFRAYGDRLGLMHALSQGRLRPHAIWNSEACAAVVRPGGNVRGPLRELGRFYGGLLSVLNPDQTETLAGSSLLRPATLKEFTRRSREGMFDETFKHALDWGLGFGVNNNRHGPETAPYGFGRHAGESTFGHGGSQSSCGFADPTHQLAVAWLCNGMIGEAAHQERARAINDAIYEDLGLP